MVTIYYQQVWFEGDEHQIGVWRQEAEALSIESLSVVGRILLKADSRSLEVGLGRLFLHLLFLDGLEFCSKFLTCQRVLFFFLQSVIACTVAR